MMNLYCEETVSKIKLLIPQFISGKRLSHTYAVAEECAALAEIFCRFPTLLSPEDGYRLRIAGLLHDITKQKTTEEQIALCAEYRIPLTDFEKASPKVLHAKTAAAVAPAKLNPLFGAKVADDAVCDAIATHTTGNARMSLIGKLLYLADYIEPTRTFEDCVTLRSAFYDSLAAHLTDADTLSAHLDETLLLSFDMTIRDLLANRSCVDPNTTAARNALLYAMQENA